MDSRKPTVSKQQAKNARKAIDRLSQLVNLDTSDAPSIWSLPGTWLFAPATKETVSSDNANPIVNNLPFSRRSSFG